MILNILNDYYEKHINTSDFYNLETGHYNYYYADEFNSKIYLKNLIKIDIKSAFPTICNLLFDKNSEFIQQLNSIEDKLEKNIFISNSLKVLTDKNYLKLLNQYCKIIVFTQIYNNYENIEVFEYQKDGVLFTGEKIPAVNKDIQKILTDNFIFHLDKINLYLRFQKTSLFITNQIDIKGQYKNPPKYLYKKILPLIFEDEYNPKLNNIINIYNTKYFMFLKHLNLSEELLYYFRFNEKYYLDNNGKKTMSISECDPSSPLRYFIFPILELLRTN